MAGWQVLVGAKPLNTWAKNVVYLHLLTSTNIYEGPQLKRRGAAWRDTTPPCAVHDSLDSLGVEKCLGALKCLLTML